MLTFLQPVAGNRPGLGRVGETEQLFGIGVFGKHAGYTPGRMVEPGVNRLQTLTPIHCLHHQFPNGCSGYRLGVVC